MFEEEKIAYTEGFQVFELGCTRIARCRLMACRGAKHARLMVRRELLKVGIDPDGKVDTVFNRSDDSYTYRGELRIKVKHPVKRVLVDVPAGYARRDHQVMTNNGHAICQHCIEDLKENKHTGLYTARNFMGIVWYCRKLGRFYCNVWMDKVHKETVIRNSLEGIMQYCCMVYGEE